MKRGSPKVCGRAWLGCVPVLVLAAGAVCRDAAAADQAPAAPAEKHYEVRTVADLPYYDGADADKVKHKLDLYLPKGRADFPVIFFVHGGAWSHGDKDSPLNIYKNFGTFWARRGIGAVVTNYRLSPKVTHPAHIRDVARAFAWTYRHVGEYGGRQDELFVCGHSAGGHLVSLLATDESYLKAEGVSPKAIRGAIPMSGVYRLAGGNGLMKNVFGDDKVCRAASPMTHIRPGEPPFLIIYAENDLAPCGKAPSEAFCKALVENQCSATSCEVKDRNHISLILKVSREHDPAAEAIARFIAAQTRPEGNGRVKVP